jgi:hypothetical protein
MMKKVERIKSRLGVLIDVGSILRSPQHEYNPKAYIVRRIFINDKWQHQGEVIVSSFQGDRRNIINYRIDSLEWYVFNQSWEVKIANPNWK